jgi:hypothetical protein
VRAKRAVDKTRPGVIEYTTEGSRIRWVLIRLWRRGQPERGQLGLTPETSKDVRWL